ncbi:MAG: DUF6463 family protein [Pseudomonadota bacterium]
MMKHVGPLMISMGIVHLAVSFVLFPTELLEIWRAGPLAGLSWTLDMLAGFWFLIFTWPMIAVGVVFRESYKTLGDNPGRRFVGASFILMPIVSGVFLPTSGLWFFIVPGTMLLLGRPTRPEASA